MRKHRASIDFADLIARAAAKVKPPWHPLATAPRGVKVLGVWMDIDGAWNAEICTLRDGEWCGNGGQILLIAGWMPLPRLPGRAREL